KAAQSYILLQSCRRELRKCIFSHFSPSFNIASVYHPGSGCSGCSDSSAPLGTFFCLLPPTSFIIPFICLRFPLFITVCQLPIPRFIITSSHSAFHFSASTSTFINKSSAPKRLRSRVIGRSKPLSTKPDQK